MEGKTLMRVSLLLALAGLLLVFASQEGYEKAELASLSKGCAGKVYVDGEVKGAFFTKSGGYAVSLSKDVFVALGSEAAFRGDRVMVKGRAQQYNGKCWVFADSARVL